MECPRKFYWADVRRLRLPEDNVHLHFGHVYAAAHDVARTQWLEGQSTPQDCLNTAIYTACYEWGSFPNNNKKNIYSLVASLRAYYNKFPLNKDKVQPYWIAKDEPSIEAKHTAVLPINNPETGDPLLWYVRFDWKGLDTVGNLYVIDDKTTSTVPAMWYEQWQLSNQLLSYVWTTREQGVGDKAIYAQARCAAIYKAGPQIIKSEPMLYKEWQLESWYQSTLVTINKIIKDWEDNTWPQSFGTACGAYGRRCNYWDLCMSNDPEPIVEAEYIHHPRQEVY